jgi:hypothetical protein
MIATLTPAGAEHIAKHMRASDRAEVLAVAAVDSPAKWARAVQSLPGVGLMVVTDGEPVAMGGCLMCGHIAGLWFVATDRIKEPAVRVDCHRLALRLHRDLAARGVRRCQVQPSADNREIARWLDRLGYGLEGTHPGHGKNGETFTTWGKLLVPHAN